MPPPAPLLRRYDLQRHGNLQQLSQGLWGMSAAAISGAGTHSGSRSSCSRTPAATRTCSNAGAITRPVASTSLWISACCSSPLAGTFLCLRR